MNIFVPALVAVLFAEFGGRATQLLRLKNLSVAALLLGLSVGVAAFAGMSLAPTMNSHARALLLGIAFVLSGFNQFGKAPSSDPPATLLGTLLFVWRSGAPFLAFALASWRDAPISAAAGSLAGVAAAVALGVVPLADNSILWLRRAAGATLVGTGLYAGLWALRFIA